MNAVLVYADGKTEVLKDCNGAHWWLVPLPIAERDDHGCTRYRPFVMVDPAVANGAETFVYVEQPWEHFQSPASAGGVHVTRVAGRSGSEGE
jgi:hypothetical protein